MWGHIDYQIEHHLFPDIPSRHYYDIAPEVQAICRKHNIAYKSNPNIFIAISRYLAVFWRYSFEPKALAVSPSQTGTLIPESGQIEAGKI